jgi:hypothetical protein
MSPKRNKFRKSTSSSTEAAPGVWKRVLMLLPLTPLAAGLLLIFGSVADMIVWISPPDQALLGGMFVLGSFAAFNAVQQQWDLATGWLLLAVGIWLGLVRSALLFQLLGLALVVGGLYFLAREFFRRLGQQQAQKAKKRK